MRSALNNYQIQCEAPWSRMEKYGQDKMIINYIYKYSNTAEVHGPINHFLYTTREVIHQHINPRFRIGILHMQML